MAFLNPKTQQAIIVGVVLLLLPVLVIVSFLMLAKHLQKDRQDTVTQTK